MPLEKCFFCTHNISKRKTHAEHRLTHLNKTAYEIWSVCDKVHFWVKNLAPYFHRSLQLFLGHVESTSTMHANLKNKNQYSYYFLLKLAHYFLSVCLAMLITSQEIDLLFEPFTSYQLTFISPVTNHHWSFNNNHSFVDRK